MLNHNESIEYKKLIKILKRYSFDEKMRVCNVYSKKIINIQGKMKIGSDILGQIYPWELETFLLIAIKTTPEYAQGNFKGKNIRQFIKMINGIRDFRHPKLEEKRNGDSFVEYLLSSISLLQLEIQKENLYKLYRYNYIFNFSNKAIDIKKVFKELFKTEYEDYINFAISLTILLHIESNKNYNNFPEIYELLYTKKFPVVLNTLIITLEDYKKQLDKITIKFEDYITCLRPSYTFPFIKYNSHIYLPLPHLIYRATTSSLLYRMTENNDKLREIIGKEILESYLYKILKDANVYDEIYPEKKYKKEHNNIASTLDVMIRQNKDYLFLDSKSFTPSIGLRVFDEASFRRQTDRLAENVVQVYKNIREYFFKYPTYNPFKICDHKDIDNLWGIVVLLEDCYIQRHIVYNRAAQILNIEKDSQNFQWIIDHIKIVELYDIERYSFAGISLLDILKSIPTRNYDFFLKYEGKLKIKNQEVINFNRIHLDKTEAIFSDLFKNA